MFGQAVTLSAGVTPIAVALWINGLPSASSSTQGTAQEYHQSTNGAGQHIFVFGVHFQSGKFSTTTTTHALASRLLLINISLFPDHLDSRTDILTHVM